MLGAFYFGQPYLAQGAPNTSANGTPVGLPGTTTTISN